MTDQPARWQRITAKDLDGRELTLDIDPTCTTRANLDLSVVRADDLAGGLELYIVVTSSVKEVQP